MHTSRMPDRQLLGLTVVLSLGASAVALVTSGFDWLSVAISFPFFITASYYSLRLSRWLGNRAAPQQPPPSEHQPTEATTSRPEHAQQRRQRRRRKSRR